MSEGIVKSAVRGVINNYGAISYYKGVIPVFSKGLSFDFDLPILKIYTIKYSDPVFFVLIIFFRRLFICFAIQQRKSQKNDNN